MAAQFVTILYSIADRIYLGNLAQGGGQALAAVGVCAPALTILNAFAFLAGTGGAVLMSSSAGRRDQKTAQQAVNTAFTLALILSAAVFISGMIFKRPLLYALGCGDTLYPFADRYFTICLFGSFAVICGTGMNQFILAQGFAKQGLVSVVLGAVINIVLDPILIYGAGMGITGAAAATIIGQFASAAYVMRFLLGSKPVYRLEIGRFNRRCAAEIFRVGFLPFLIVLLDNILLISLNSSLQRYGGDQADAYLACTSVIQSFITLASLPAQGITTGCGTLYSFHWGAGNGQKVRQVFKWVFILCISYIGILFIFVQTVPQVFTGMFSGGSSMLASAPELLRMYTLGLPALAVQYAVVDGLTSMGMTRIAMPVSLFRKGLYLLCVAVIPQYWNIRNVFYACPISDIAGSALSIIVFFTVVRKLLDKRSVGF